MTTCRCYADVTFGDHRKNQICGTKHDKDLIVPAPEGCCPGGCPGQTDGIEPREPYGFGKMYNIRVFTWLIAFFFITAAILTYLKIVVL
jgi:hypothetical protein